MLKLLKTSLNGGSRKGGNSIAFRTVFYQLFFQVTRGCLNYVSARVISVLLVLMKINNTLTRQEKKFIERAFILLDNYCSEYARLAPQKKCIPVETVPLSSDHLDALNKLILKYSPIVDSPPPYNDIELEGTQYLSGIYQHYKEDNTLGFVCDQSPYGLEVWLLSMYGFVIFNASRSVASRYDALAHLRRISITDPNYQNRDTHVNVLMDTTTNIKITEINFKWIQSIRGKFIKLITESPSELIIIDSRVTNIDNGIDEFVSKTIAFCQILNRDIETTNELIKLSKSIDDLKNVFAVGQFKNADYLQAYTTEITSIIETVIIKNRQLFGIYTSNARVALNVLTEAISEPYFTVDYSNK